MSKEFTTQQKLMQATQYGILVYAQQRENCNDRERLKLEITLQGLCRYASEMQYTHGEAERERIKEILDLVYEIQKY